MAIGITNMTWYSDIAAAIREINGQTGRLYLPSEMAAAILALDLGGAAGNTFTVEKEAGADYGFTLTDGWYVRDNASIHNSCAMVRITFNLSEAKTVLFTVVNYGENGWDYGVLSEIDRTLSNSVTNSANETDRNNGAIKFNGSSGSMAAEQTVTYDMPAGEHFIIAKYKKDASTNANEDMFKFKFEIL